MTTSLPKERESLDTTKEFLITLDCNAHRLVKAVEDLMQRVEALQSHAQAPEGDEQSGEVLDLLLLGGEAMGRATDVQLDMRHTLNALLSSFAGLRLPSLEAAIERRA